MLVILCFVLNFHPVHLNSAPLLLITSFDGFRYDFLSSKNTPNLWKLANEGVRFTKGVRPQYLTTTGPNHYSIVTGLYQESHGIVGNSFFDPEIGDFFEMFDNRNQTRFNSSQNGRWYAGTVPIWLTNQQASRKNPTNQRRLSGCMYWPSCSANISGQHPKYYRGVTEVRNLTGWKRDFDTLSEWFLHPTDPINFGLFYVRQPDEVLHHFGYSAEFYSNLSALDQLAAYMVSRLKDSNLLDKINLIFTADHGHSKMKKPKSTETYSIVDLIDNPDDVIYSNFCLFPASEKTDMNAIYEKFAKASSSGLLPATVFKKENFPDSFYWKNSPRVGPIIFVRHLGQNVQYNNSNPNLETSDHGFSPDEIEMRPFLVLFGPDFARNLVFEEKNVENIDLYPLMCHLLGIDPLPNNGSFERISPVLLKKPQTLDLSNFLQSYDQKLVIVTAFGIFVPGICLLCYMLTCVMNAKPKGTVSAGYVRLANQQAQNRARGLVSDSEEDQM